MPEDFVADEEILYRAVKNTPQNLPVDSEGVPRLSRGAFADRNSRPSVDRALLRGFVAEKTQFSPTDGVLRLSAFSVRQIHVFQNDAKGRPVKEHVADVEPIPTEENPAHAEIYGRPLFDNESVFDEFVTFWCVTPNGQSNLPA